MTTTSPTILALVPDLWFLSRLRSAAEAAGLAVEVVRRVDRLAGRAAELAPVLIVVDMGIVGQDWAAAVTAVKADPTTAAIPLIAFGPHVDQASQAAARVAGADRVLSNRRFTERLPELLAWSRDDREGVEPQRHREHRDDDEDE
jgi:CheY-like chemotaxis protein